MMEKVQISNFKGDILMNKNNDNINIEDGSGVLQGDRKQLGTDEHTIGLQGQISLFTSVLTRTLWGSKVLYPMNTI